LSRLTHFSQALNPKAKKILRRHQPNLNNPFNNNLAQSIEILHFLEETVILIEKLSTGNLANSKGIEKIKLPLKAVAGRACLETPRGILYHEVKIDTQGKTID